MSSDTEVTSDEYILDGKLRRVFYEMEYSKFFNAENVYKVANYLDTLHGSSISTLDKNRSNSDTSPCSRVPKDSSEVMSSNSKNILKNQISRDDIESIVSPTTEEFMNSVNSQETTHSSANVSNSQNISSSTFDVVSPNKNVARRLHYSPNTIQNRKTRLLVDWRVTLDKKNQLRIVGTTESGKLVLTEPVAKRITLSTVESVCKNLYSLEGNLVDEDCELPEYIHDKFYNGFPNNWKKVCELWTNFVQRGSKATFRWWAESSGSEEDSEVMATASTYAKDSAKRTRGPNSFNRSRQVPLLNFERTFNVPRSNEGDDEKDDYSYMNDISTDTRATNTSEKPFCSIAVQTLTEQCFFGENCENRENIFSKRPCAKKTKDEIIKNLNKIVDYLMDENCSPEYMSAIAKMFRFMDYFASSQPKKNVDSSLEPLYDNDSYSDIDIISPRKNSTTVTSQRSERSMDSMNAISVGVSSRGRRIVPPLSYWTGERIVSINDEPTYSPATSQIVSLNSSSSSTNKSSNKTNTQQANKHRRNSLKESKDVNANSTKKGTNTADKSTDDSRRSKSKKNVRRNKGRTVKMQSNDSSDIENIPLTKAQSSQESRRRKKYRWDFEERVTSMYTVASDLLCAVRYLHDMLAQVHDFPI